MGTGQLGLLDSIDEMQDVLIFSCNITSVNHNNKTLVTSTTMMSLSF